MGPKRGKIGTSLRYSSAPVTTPFRSPLLTEKNKADLTRCAQDNLLAREAHFPATLAGLYDPETMPADHARGARAATTRCLERTYIGRRFKNDTERLEKLFELYTKMTAVPGRGKKTQGRRQAHERRNEVSSIRFRFLTPATATSTKANALGMRPMQERAYERRGEQYLLIKSPPASGKSRALDVHRPRQAPAIRDSSRRSSSCRRSPSARASMTSR